MVYIVKGDYMTMKNCISHLAEEIGARPVGTDEEQAAAFYIKEAFDKQSNLETEIQEFKCSMNPNVPRVVESIFCVLSTVVALISQSFLIPCAIIAVICGILFILDYFDVFTLASFLGNAPSQNVIAKYEPFRENTSGRNKKVVLITNYDSEKIRPERSTFKSIAKYLPYIELGGVALTILTMLLILLTGANIFYSVLLIISAICCLVLPLLFVLQQVSPYNAAANCNAASVAVMLDVAEKLNNEIVVPVAPKQYGRKVAEEAGLLSEDVPVEWESETTPLAPSDAMLSAEESDIQSGETQAFEHIDADDVFHSEVSTDRSAISQALPEQDLESSLNADLIPEQSRNVNETKFHEATQLSFNDTPRKTSVPDWFTQAKKDAAANSVSDAQSSEIKRSVFADALEHANNPLYGEEVENNKEAGKTDLEKQLEIIHAQINAEGAQALKNTSDFAKQAEHEVEDLHDAVVAFENIPPEKNLDDDVTIREADSATLSKPAEIMPRTVKPEVEKSVPIHNNIFESIPSVSEENATLKKDNVGSDADTIENEPSDLKNADVAASELETIVIEPISEKTQRLSEDVVTDYEVTEGSQVPDINPTLSEELSAPVINRTKPKKREISLPSLTSAIEADKVAHELKKKTDAENERVKAESKNIKDDDEILPSGVVKHIGNNAENKISTLSANLPSLNLNFDLPKKTDSTVAVAGSFNVGDATGTFAPIGDELIAGKSESEIYVDDVDDSDYGTNITETGAMAGPELVDIPGTRAESVFGKMFHRKKNNNKTSDSFSAGIGVDEDFDAREVGKNRGDWSSFADDDEWEGGMFSKAKEKIAGGSSDINLDTEHEEDAITHENVDVQVYSQDSDSYESQARKRYTSFGELLAKSHISVNDTSDREEVYNFVVGAVPYDVWCVALGAENSDHAGLKAFLSENGEELKGATFVVMNGLGAGELSLVKGDGRFKKASISPRLKRYAKSAAKKLHINLNDCNLQGRDTIASCLMDNGYSCLHLAGVENGAIAFDSTKDDTLDVVDDLRIAESSEFISQLLREL